MTDTSTYLGGALLAWIKGTTFPAAPASVQVALFLGDPATSGVEKTGAGGLTRQTVTFGAEAARTILNTAEVNFGTASADASVDFAAIYDAGGTNMLSSKAFTQVNVLSGQKVTFDIGDLGLGY